MLLVNKQYCLNCYWRDLLREGDLRSDDTKVRPRPQHAPDAGPAGLHQAGLHALSSHLAPHTGTVSGRALTLPAGEDLPVVSQTFSISRSLQSSRGPLLNLTACSHSCRVHNVL